MAELKRSNWTVTKSDDQLPTIPDERPQSNDQDEEEMPEWKQKVHNAYINQLKAEELAQTWGRKWKILDERLNKAVAYCDKLHIKANGKGMTVVERVLAILNGEEVER